MDFSDFSTNTREVQFTLPDGTKTGFHLTLRYESAQEVQQVTKKYRHRFMEAQRKGKRGNQDKLSEQFEIDRVIAHVAGWRWEDDSKATWKGERPEFSDRTLKDMLDSGEFGYLLKDFITDEIGDASDFLD